MPYLDPIRDPMIVRIHDVANAPDRRQALHAAVEAMDMLGLPAAALDLDGTVLAANRLLQEARFGLTWRANDRIALDTPGSHRLLRLAIADLAKAASSVRFIPVPATAARGACILHLIATAGSASELFGGGYVFLVVTPLSAGPTSVPALEGLFDLTPAEARVARKIALGHSVEKIAQDCAVSRETVRTHMKAIFSKTGMNKQAQVAALVAGVPRIPLMASHL